jgi:hypothetical protein
LTRSSFFSTLVITWGEIDLTPYAQMPKRTNNLKKTNFTNVGFNASFICINASLCKCFPFTCGTDLCSNNCFLFVLLKCKKNYLKFMHSSMHGLGAVAPLIGWIGTQTSPTSWKDCALRANVLYTNVLLNKMRCKLELYKPNYVHLYPMSHFPWQPQVTRLFLKQ